MNMRRVVALLVLGWIGVAGVQAETVEQVVARYLEAIGGGEAMAAIHSVRKTGVYVYNGLEHPLTVVHKRGAGCREEIAGLSPWGTAVGDDHVVVRAYDGERAWQGELAGELTTSSMAEGEAVGFVLDADLDGSLVGAAAAGVRLALVGATEVDGAAVIELTATHADGVVERWYLDRESHLPVMKATDVPDSEYKAAQTWFFDDYREVGGVQMPFFVQVEEKLFAREYLFDSIEVNIDVADELFRQPPGTEVTPADG